MNPAITRLIDNRKGFVFATSKNEALRTLDHIKARIEAMGEFDRFPDGDAGVVLYALLDHLATTCTDAADFYHIYEGCELILREAFQVIKEETNWFPRPQEIEP